MFPVDGAALLSECRAPCVSPPSTLEELLSGLPCIRYCDTRPEVHIGSSTRADTALRLMDRAGVTEAHIVEEEIDMVRAWEPAALPPPRVGTGERRIGVCPFAAPRR